MRKLYHSYLSPYARRVLIVLAEKGLEYKSHKHKFARELEGLSAINPCLLLPVYIDDAVHLWGSNLIVEYLLKTYPTTPTGSPEPPLASTMTRPDHHWEDARILATLETMTDSIMNLRQMKMSGLETNDVVYLQRQRKAPLAKVSRPACSQLWISTCYARSAMLITTRASNGAVGPR